MEHRLVDFFGPTSTGYSFNNEFDLTSSDLSTLKIVRCNSGSNCLIQEKKSGRCYDKFLLNKNRRSRLRCEVKFYRSSENNHYIPRLSFRRISTKTGEETEIKADKPVVIDLSEGIISARFWRLINFLGSFKDLVDTGDFHDKFTVETKDRYFVEFTDKASADQFKDLRQLINRAGLSSQDLKLMFAQVRKTAIKQFYELLKRKTADGRCPFERYRMQHNVKQAGDEPIWQHFFEQNDWLLGLNVDIKFIEKFLREQRTNSANTDGREDPRVDFMGIANYTTLVELKTAKTLIFTENKQATARANTWSFSSEFIDAISQTCGQKLTWERSAASKKLVDNDEIISQEVHRTVDCKAILIIGTRYTEFPHESSANEITKSEVFEAYRRGNRSVEIITFDELFERAYCITYFDKIKADWFTSEEFYETLR